MLTATVLLSASDGDQLSLNVQVLVNRAGKLDFGRRDDVGISRALVSMYRHFFVHDPERAAPSSHPWFFPSVGEQECGSRQVTGFFFQLGVKDEGAKRDSCGMRSTRYLVTSQSSDAVLGLCVQHARGHEGLWEGGGLTVTHARDETAVQETVVEYVPNVQEEEAQRATRAVEVDAYEEYPERQEVLRVDP